MGGGSSGTVAGTSAGSTTATTTLVKSKQSGSAANVPPNDKENVDPTKAASSSTNTTINATAPAITIESDDDGSAPSHTFLVIGLPLLLIVVLAGLAFLYKWKRNDDTTDVGEQHHAPPPVMQQPVVQLQDPYGVSGAAAAATGTHNLNLVPNPLYGNNGARDGAVPNNTYEATQGAPEINNVYDKWGQGTGGQRNDATLANETYDTGCGGHGLAVANETYAPTDPSSVGGAAEFC
jgi:hypothetical protein